MSDESGEVNQAYTHGFRDGWKAAAEGYGDLVKRVLWETRPAPAPPAYADADQPIPHPDTVLLDRLEAELRSLRAAIAAHPEKAKP